MEHFSQIAQRNVGALRPESLRVDDIIEGEATVIYSLDQLSEQALITEQLFIISANQTLIHALELGKIYTAAKNQLSSQREFEDWLKSSTKKIGLSQAYKYMTLEKDMELIDWAVQSTGQLTFEKVVAMISAPPDLKEDIKQQIDSGKKISVADINKYKRRAEQAEKEAAQARKDADEWRVGMQTQQQINERNNGLIETKAQELLKTKAAEIEEQALAAAGAEYQATIDSLQDTKSSLLAKLATVERTGERAQIEADIAAAQAELQALTVTKNQAEYEYELRNVSAHSLELTTLSRTELLATGMSSLPIEDATYNLLMDAHESLQRLSEMFYNLANPPTLTLEE